MAQEPRIIKHVDSGNAYFSILWSEIKKAEKYDIVRSVPSISGIFELYFMDDHKKLNLFFLSKAYYGGLKNEIRRCTDTELEKDANRKKILDKYDIYYRWVPSDSYADLTDILYFFSCTYFPNNKKHDHSGRYIDIFVEEKNTGKLVDV
ncbi:MAG: hypothetical protein JW904_04725 [Spirochaetales bacterium]|nr:hypothetical protein [Spirochaetales bacterium]